MSPAAGDIKARVLGLVQGRVDKLFVVGIVVSLLILGGLRFGESSTIPPPEPMPQPKAPKVFIEDSSPEYAQSTSFVKPMVSFDESEFSILEKFNMFNARTAKDMEEQRKEADSLLQQAQTLMDQGNLGDARELAQQVYDQGLARKAAQDLLKEIEKAEKGSESEEN